jgi:tRNA pseudouridine55 synthase
VTVDGLAVIDKPAGMTSHDVVARLRKHFGQKRVGHAGTLDPDATGVLLVGLGRVTRLLRFLTALGKTYTGEVVLGVETATLDAAGEVVATHDMAGIGIDDVRAVLPRFTGDILQVPPMVSAVKIGGRRLHELARAGVEVDRPPRPVTVHALTADPTDDPSAFRIEVTSSAGTYVRTLAADIGAALGGGAHLRNLRRTAAGSFTIAEAWPLDDPHPLSPAEAVRDLSRITVDDEGVQLVSFGRPLAGAAGIEGPCAVLGPDGELLAVYEGAKPAVVLAAAGS